VLNAEWRHLHEQGSLVAYLNHDEQLHESKFSDKGDGSELTEEESEKMQKDELDKCKAWEAFGFLPKRLPWHLLKRNKA
jgi:hypothetical protein